MNPVFNLVLVTDCGGSDEGRYRIAVQRCFFPHQHSVAFFPTASMNTLHCGFTAAAHGLSTIDHFGPLRDGENYGVLINAAPRRGKENGQALRGEDRKRDGEEVFIVRFDNGVWASGPNAEMNFWFVRDRIRESYLVTDTSGRETPFRSMELMIPALAKVQKASAFDRISLEEKQLTVQNPDSGLYVADWDEHGNIYVVSTETGDAWIPPMGRHCVIKIGDKIARLRHVKGIFAGNTGEPTLTTGSLRLNGKSVYYMVVVGASAHSLFEHPRVGARVEIEE
jgi:hypothetical protein